DLTQLTGNVLQCRRYSILGRDVESRCPTDVRRNERFSNYPLPTFTSQVIAHLILLPASCPADAHRHYRADGHRRQFRKRPAAAPSPSSLSSPPPDCRRVLNFSQQPALSPRSLGRDSEGRGQCRDPLQLRGSLSRIGWSARF